MAGWPGAEVAAADGQDALVPAHGLRRVIGRQVCGRQLGGDDLGVRVTGRQFGLAASGQVLPVSTADPTRRAACGLRQARSSSGWHPSAHSTRAARAGLQAGRVRAATHRGPWLRLVGRPRLEQCAGGCTRHGVLDVRGRDQPDRRLQHRVIRIVGGVTAWVRLIRPARSWRAGCPRPVWGRPPKRKARRRRPGRPSSTAC